MINEVIERILIQRNKTVDDMILGEIRKIATENGIDTIINLNDKAIIQALKKQIPQKPYPRDLWELGTAQGYSCPTCGYDFPVSYFEPHCCKCGQAILWRGDTK